jgi:hypothetical protein
MRTRSLRNAQQVLRLKSQARAGPRASSGPRLRPGTLENNTICGISIIARQRSSVGKQCQDMQSYSLTATAPVIARASVTAQATGTAQNFSRTRSYEASFESGEVDALFSTVLVPLVLVRLDYTCINQKSYIMHLFLWPAMALCLIANEWPFCLSHVVPGGYLN